MVILLEMILSCPNTLQVLHLILNRRSKLFFLLLQFSHVIKISLPVNALGLITEWMTPIMGVIFVHALENPWRSPSSP